MNDLNAIARFVIYPQLVPIISDMISNRIPVAATGNVNANELYPVTKLKSFVKISTLSSKELRLNAYPMDEKLICIYKLGMILTPGEVKHWTRSIKKLASSRHKNIILRIAHGDIYSNERLCRFGLLEVQTAVKR